MSLTLLVENNSKIESFYKLNLSTWLGLEIKGLPSGEATVKYLEKDISQVELIIVRSQIDKEQTAKLLIEYLKLRKLDIPMVIIGPGSFVPSHQVVNSLDLKLLLKTVAVCKGITAKDMSEKVVPDFFPIPLEFFYKIKRPICDVYSQSSDNSKSYNLCIEKQKDFEPALIDTFKKEGASHLYVDKMYRLEIVSQISAEIIATLEHEELSPDEQVSATDKSIELLSKKLMQIGMTEETIQLAKKNMDIIKSQVKRNPKLSKLLDRLMSNKASYLYTHTQLLTYVALHIVHNIDWGTPEQEEKISFICFFHDIALETDEQCMIKSNAELKRSKMSPAAKTLVERHAQIAAEYVSKFPHAPMGTDQIIRQHHGQLNGIGFSDHYGANVSPMAVVFIVAEEFTRIIMKQDGSQFNKEEMLKELKEEFPTSRFAKIVEKLQTLTL